MVYTREGRTTKRLHVGSQTFYLKADHPLGAERDRLRWLAAFRPTPEVLGFHADDHGPDWLLTRAAIGTDLTATKYTSHPEVIVRLLAEALTSLHQIDQQSCPFGRAGPGLVVVHGDACLPNFLAVGNRISSYLDVGELRIDRPEVDLAAAIWSLQHNLGPGWGAPFLSAYGWASDDESTVEKLRLDYERT